MVGSPLKVLLPPAEIRSKADESPPVAPPTPTVIVLSPNVGVISVSLKPPPEPPAPATLQPAPQAAEEPSPD